MTAYKDDGTQTKMNRIILGKYLIHALVLALGESYANNEDIPTLEAQIHRLVAKVVRTLTDEYQDSHSVYSVWEPRYAVMESLLESGDFQQSWDVFWTTAMAVNDDQKNPTHRVPRDVLTCILSGESAILDEWGREV